MTTGKYIAWLICCVVLIAFLIISGIYMLYIGLGAWCLFPFIIAIGVGDAGNNTTIKENKQKDSKEKDIK